MSHPPSAEVSTGLTLPHLLLADLGHVIPGVSLQLALLQRPLHGASAQHFLFQLLQFPLDVFVTESVTEKVNVSCSASAEW